MDKKLDLKYAIWIMVVIHFFGVLGMLSPYRDLFITFTPLNLMITLALLLYYQDSLTSKYLRVMGFVMISSFFLEVVGVNTGYPFGDYTYQTALGWKWLGTPFLIGVNWFFMSFCGALLMHKVTKSLYVNALLTGLLITALDYIMEPVAIAYDFWSWAGDEIPIQNYITWVVAIAFYAVLIYRYLPDADNKIAKWVLGVQVLFFGTLSMALYLGVRLDF